MLTWADPDSLKIISAVSMFVGTLLVSWRVTVILKALIFFTRVQEANLLAEITKAYGVPIPNIKLHGAYTGVERAEKFGLKLLIAGFFMQLIGVICNILSFLV